MSKPLICMLSFVVCAFSLRGDCREWNVATNKVPIEAEIEDILVQVKTADGNKYYLQFDLLSNDDREFICSQFATGLQDKGRNQNQLTVSAIFKGDAADNPGRGNEYALLEELANVDIRQTGMFTSPKTIEGLNKCLALLEANRVDLPQYKSELLKLNGKLIHFVPELRYFINDNGSDAISVVGKNGMLNGTSIYVFWQQLQSMKRCTQTLSLLSPTDRDVEKEYKNRIKQLAEDPSPQIRKQAALRLMCAYELSDKAVPALIASIETDASQEVRLVSMISLAGFTNSKSVVMPVLVKKLKSLNDGESEEARRVIIWLLVKMEPESSIVRKYVRDNLKYGADTSWVLDVLNLEKPQAKMAVGDLLRLIERQILDSESIGTEWVDLIMNTAPNDPRFRRLLEAQSKNGTPDNRVYCDSVLKKLLSNK